MGQSYDNLLSGYRQFKCRYAAGNFPVMERLATEGQRPKVMIIACCDSRVDPALLLQCHPGDLFVVRNVANIIPPYELDMQHHGTSAALEYAVCYLEINDLIILGHSQCGGLHALVNEDSMLQNDFITNWVSLSGLKTATGSVDCIDTLAKQSLHTSFKNCLSFPWIEQRVSENTLNIHQWFLDIKKGDVYEFDTAQQVFSLL
jgi:carbonic anhydrase